MHEHTRHRYRPYLTFLVMLGLVMLAYSPVVRCGYIWDDDDYVIHNTTLRDVHGLKEIWTQPGAVPQYYPLVYTTFWVEYHLWKLKPLGYHLVNVALHLCVALLWWRLLAMLNVPAAWLAAMLFAVHPVHVESVAWITERKNVLSGVFYLFAACSYWTFFTRENKGKITRWGWYTLSFACFVAALLSKTVTATLPAALVLVLWYRRKRFPWRDLLYLLPFFVLGIAMGLFTAHMEATHVGARGDEFSLTLIQRALLAGRVIWIYAGKLFWPAELVFFYPRRPLLPQTFMAWLYPLGVIGVTWMLLKNRKVWGGHWLVGWLFFIGTLFPALGFLNVFPMKFSWVADHFQYLASMGILVMVAMVLEQLRRRCRLLGTLLITGILLALTVRTMVQVPVYRNVMTLWEHVVVHNLQSWAAKNNLGAIYAGNGRFDEALHLFRQSLALNLKQTKGYENIGSYHFTKWQWDKAEYYYHICLEKEPGNIRIRLKLARALYMQKRLPEALEQAGECVRRKPDFADGWALVGTVLSDLKQFHKAVQAWQKAISFNPNEGYMHYCLGLAAFKDGQLEMALHAQQHAMKLEPYLAAPSNQLALIASKQGKWQMALEMVEKAFVLEPNNPVVQQRYIWLNATVPTSDHKQHVRALELTRELLLTQPITTCKDMPLARSFAAAFAANGDFDQAIAWQKRALTLAQQQTTDGADMQAMLNALKLYQEHQPCKTP